VLDGLCAHLGVDEATGQQLHGTAAQGLRIAFVEEASSGDSLRREWFGLVAAEMLDRNRGLFISKDENRTLQPNPDSATTVGDDHLSYFALLGRIAGLALYHRETLDVAWTSSFMKAAFGYPIGFDDLKATDQPLHDSLRSLLEMPAADLEACCLTFTVENDAAVVYDSAAKRRRAIELKPGGEDLPVTADNVREYLQLYAEHRLVGEFSAQTAAFRSGLSVFFNEELLGTVHRCITVAELELLLCGTARIDVDDWQGSTRYEPSTYADSTQVRWFWVCVRAMSTEEQAKLLFFCSGSTRPPATGFKSLMGYGGQEHRFTIARVDGAGSGRLPTAHACFNKLDLPAYATEAVLQAKMQLAIAGARGFDEAAVAV
jgi:hypothetical protein